MSLRLLFLEANLLFRLAWKFFFYLPLFNACNEYHIFMKTLFKKKSFITFKKIPKRFMEDCNFKAFGSFLY